MDTDSNTDMDSDSDLGSYKHEFGQICNKTFGGGSWKSLLYFEKILTFVHKVVRLLNQAS